ncbi:DUF3231 family protein [Metabacillus halosaccharovorans]|uniref:DUF3231 family protein n=1 Tax=Metabacillus halosaccharovorans TaxID=930124 RepID=UPI001C1F921B|nr:DUF3231 family protein [Metabacillus halosaccharovorans]MBU7594832.1 DUF3231 family protein [Metabacillus halosaccharovorans]
MGNNHDLIKLTSSELSYLWSTYLADSMSICVLKYFLEHVDDEDIKSLTVHALKLSEEHVKFISEIYSKEEIQIPQGFTEDDVNLKAKRLFSDVFYLRYIRNMAKGGLVTYGRVLQNTYRQDVRSFFSKCLTDTIELDTNAAVLLLEKGLLQRPPAIPYPEKLEFVHKQSFILEGLGRRKELTGTEVTNLYANIQTNYLGVGLATAFSQVAKSDKVRKYFLRGKEISLKHIKVFGSYLEMASLPLPASFEQEVSESQESPFSDKIMMFHFSLMIYAGIGNFGVSIAETQRSDLIVDYSRLVAEVLKFSEDGVNIMIANEWLEQPPLSANRSDLSKG